MRAHGIALRGFEERDRRDFFEMIREKMAETISAYDDQYPTDEAGLSGVFDYFKTWSDAIAAFDSESETLIGFFVINPSDENTRNFGYFLRPSWRGRGIASEAGARVIEMAKRKGAKELVTYTADINEPSKKLLMRLGFTEIARSEGATFVKDEDGRDIKFTAVQYTLKL